MLTILVEAGQQSSFQRVVVEGVEQSYLAVVGGLRRCLVEEEVIVAAERLPVGSTDNTQHSFGNHHKPRRDHRLAD
jgi:hypothetical protein